MTPRRLLMDHLRFGSLAQFMRGWTEWQRDQVVSALADDLLGSGWIAEDRQQARCFDCRDCGCQGSHGTSKERPVSAEQGPTDEFVTVPRAALVHVLDWHNKTPCGVGQESMDEVCFGALRAALHGRHPCCDHCRSEDGGCDWNDRHHAPCALCAPPVSADHEVSQ